MRYGGRRTNPKSAGLHADAREHAAVGKKIPTGELVGIFNWCTDADLERIGSTPGELDQFVRKELSKYARVVKETGMSVQ